MKKTLFLLFVVLLLKIPLCAQTPYWIEDFSSGQSWTIEENWTIQTNALQFYWSPVIEDFDLSAISSEIELLENSQELIITQFLDAFGASNPSEVAEISIISSGEEELMWSHELANGNWGQAGGSELILDISNYGGETVNIKFRTFGPSTYQWNSWDIKNIMLTTLYEKDLSAATISGPLAIEVSETGFWDVMVTNLGTQPQSNFQIQLFNQKFGELLGIIDVMEPISPQETISYNFEWTPTIAQNTTLGALIIFEGDEFPDNNSSPSRFVRVKPDFEINILVWDSDNNIQTITDPEKGDDIQPSTAIKRALDAVALDYDFMTSLPANIENYDIIICTLGCYCLS